MISLSLILSIAVARAEPTWPPIIAPGVRSELPAMSPREAVMVAADAEGAAVRGIYAVGVRASDRMRNGRVYLNSELDYRDQRNVTVNIDPRAAAALDRRFGAPVQRYLAGKKLLVLGAAQRVRIDFLDGAGRPSGQYYYQTHIRVTSPDQIRVR